MPSTTPTRGPARRLGVPEGELRVLRTSGTEHVAVRVGADLLARLPRDTG